MFLFFNFVPLLLEQASFACLPCSPASQVEECMMATNPIVPLIQALQLRDLALLKRSGGRIRHRYIPELSKRFDTP